LHEQQPFLFYKITLSNNALGISRRSILEYCPINKKEDTDMEDY